MDGDVVYLHNAGQLHLRHGLSVTALLHVMDDCFTCC